MTDQSKPSFKCKVCRGIRPENNGICLGCGSKRNKCEDRSTGGKPLQCPKCGSRGKADHIAFEFNGSLKNFQCRVCGSVFEPVEADFEYMVQKNKANNASKAGRKPRR